MSFRKRAITLALIGTIFSGQLMVVPADALDRFPEPEASTAATEHVGRIRATASTRGVLVEWPTGSETDTLGFNLFRVQNGRRVQLNHSLIAGPVLIAKGRTQSNSWFDPAGTLDCEYVIEFIDLRGQSTVVYSALPAWNATLPQFQQTELLQELGLDSRSATTLPKWSNEINAKTGSQLSASLPNNGSLADQWILANQPALKIAIRSEGWYRVTHPQMVAAGFDTTGDARNLRLFVAGNEIAIRVSRDGGSLGATDFIEFWGTGLDTATTDTQVYWLINGTQPGLRMIRKGQLTIDSPPMQPVIAPVEKPMSSGPFWFFGLAREVATVATSSEREREEPSLSTNKEQTGSGPTFRPPIAPGEETKPDGPDILIVERSPPSLPATNPPIPESAHPGVLSPARSRGAVSAKAATSRAKRRAMRSSKSRGRQNKSRRRLNHVVQASAPAFIHSVRHENHSVYYSAALNGERENFFGPVVFGSGRVINLALKNIATSAFVPAQLQVALQGVSLETHVVSVFVNGSLAGTIRFSNQSSTNQSFPIPVAWLVEGDNTVRLVPVGSSHDTSVVEHIEIDYPHSFRADNDSLQFSLRSTQSARIDGFTVPNLRVLDITDPAAVEEIRPVVEASGGGFAATIPGVGRGKARRLITLPESRVTQPAWLALNQPSILNRNTNAANFVIVSHNDFIPALAPLVAQRQAQGYSVMVANVEDVFDEFSYGNHTPQAIKDFVSLAKTTWVTSPAYLLLVGDASYDPHNYLGAGNFDFVPAKQVDTGTESTATALETASDDWFTDFNDDGIADISVGRLPVRTVVQANLMVSKIVNYSPGNTTQSAMLVADTQGGYYFNFEAASDQVGALLPATMTLQKVYRRLQPSDADARANIIAKFNSGQVLTVYSGHGNVNIWAGSIFTSNDALALNNGNRLPFVVVMDCLNGFFADPFLVSLSEALLQAPNGGAVASFASSGLTLPDGQHEMGLRMFELLYSGASIPIGDASRQAKTATNDRDVRKTWILLGDPSMKIR